VVSTSSAGGGDAILVLEDGRVFRGESYGATGETFGEAVFCTGMTGYQETLTDPSYHRQVVVMTSPHVGNTGINDEDPESRRIWVSGYVVRDPARVPSNWRSTRSLDDELRDQGVVGISGIDTRALTRHLRERGAMRVGISSDTGDAESLLARVQASAEMTGAELAGEVSTTEPYVVPAVGEKRFTVAAVDLGIKANTPRMMAERGIEVHVLPAASSLEQVLATGGPSGPDGLFFSNGPGDPAATTGQVELLKGALDAGLPYFGICFGNQLFGRALGFGTFKLKYGHRGLNQPVMDRTTGKVEVTAHNHGFAVDAPLEGATQTPYGVVTVSHVCLNDDVVEGLELRDATGELKSFSVQYHPEAAAGPHDAAYLFDRFISLMSEPPRTGPAKAVGEARRLRSVGEERELASGPRDASRNPVSQETAATTRGFETGAGAPSSSTDDGGNA
jgi:carbamoyl-phosphate synthase small subunit